MERFPGRWRKYIPEEVIVTTVLARSLIHSDRVIDFDDTQG